MTRGLVLPLLLTIALLLLAPTVSAQPAAAPAKPKAAAAAKAKAKAKPPRPQSKLEIVEPAKGQTLQGAVAVKVRVTPHTTGRYPSSLYAGLGGPSFVPLAPTQNPAEWVGQLDSTLAPNGPGSVVVVGWVPQEARTTVSQPVALANPLRIFFADLHSHTGYSDGTLFPADAHVYARQQAKLDIFVLTDHLESVDDPEWLDIREQAWKANDDGKFVSIPGLEWTKKHGHANLFDPPTRHWPEDTASFYKAAAEAGVVVKFNHPGDGSKVFDGLAYSEVGDQAVELMEVRRAEEEQAFLRALELGWHLAPEGSDDTHSPNWGNGKTWTGILAPGLSKRTLLAALRARHCYSTGDRNCRLSFTAAGGVMGDILTEAVSDVPMEVVVDDPDEADAIQKIELFEDGKVVETAPAAGAKHVWKVQRKPAAGKHYYFVKLTQADGNMAWSAPIWVTVK